MNEFSSVSFFTQSIRSTVDEIASSETGIKSFQEKCDQDLVNHVAELTEEYDKKIGKDASKLKGKKLEIYNV